MANTHRVQVPMTEKALAAVDRLAAALGTSRANVAGKFLDDMAPQLIQLAEVVEQAKANPAAALDRLNAFADSAVDQLAQAREEFEQEAEQAEPRKAERKRSARPAGPTGPRTRKFWIEDLATGERWKPGLTWTDEAADRALATARKSDPGREWVLREAS